MVAQVGSGALLGVEPQIGLAVALVEAVAEEAVFAENGAYIAVVFDE